MNEPRFPPLFSGLPVTGQGDPFATAQARARAGCDAGLVVYDQGSDTLRAAIVFAPDVDLRQAMAMLPLCGVGFQNALGALAPPEVAVHLEWAGGMRVNGARCGRLRVVSAGTDPDALPDWLVVGLELQLWPTTDEMGTTPDHTALYAEGCADVDATALLEAWIRHTLVGINTWSDEGPGPLHKAWCGLAHGIGDPITMKDKSGVFLGVDEDFGMLIQDDRTTHLIPATTLLENH